MQYGAKFVKQRAINHLSERAKTQVEAQPRLCLTTSEKYARNISEIGVTRRIADNITHDTEFEF